MIPPFARFCICLKGLKLIDVLSRPPFSFMRLFEGLCFVGGIACPFFQEDCTYRSDLSRFACVFEFFFFRVSFQFI